MSAGNVIFRSQFPDLFQSRLAYLDEIIKHNYDAPAITYTEVFNVRDSGRAYEETTGVTGLSLFSTQTEGDKVEYDEILQAYDKRFTHKKYAKGVQISEDANEDDVDNAISEFGPALGTSAQQSVETVVWNVFNNGFSSETTPDGVALFSNSHVLRGGGTFDNLVSGDLSIANLEAALNQMADMRDERNLRVEMSATKLVIPYNQLWTATEILKSQMKSNTANNAINALTQVGLSIVVCKYLTNATDWFLCADSQRTKLIVYWRRRPRTDHAMDFDTGNFKTKMTYKMSTGASDWRGIIGGDGS